MNNAVEVLFALVKKVIGLDTTLNWSAERLNWVDVYRISAEQGVLALVWDAVVRLSREGVISAQQMPEKALKLEWALRAKKIKSRYHKQREAAELLAEAFAAKGISTNVLKGLAISGYYPVPELRECGDLDCFLASSANGSYACCYDEGNEIAVTLGAEVKKEFYKHSHIHYRGLMVENHAFCTAVRGSKERKALERHLQHLLSTQPSTPIEGTRLLRPCPDFNALFLTAHGFGHFLTEGIKLRHILDWAVLIDAEQDNIDWKSFYEWCDRLHYTKFVDALTAISIEYFGLTVSNPMIHTQSALRDKVLDDVLYVNHSINNRRGSKLRKRLLVLRNRLFGGWKYRELYEKSAVVDTMQMVFSFFTERTPKI